jgi:hypothetical protein
MNRIILLLSALFISANLHAAVNVTMNVRNPLPPQFTEWRNDPSIIQIILTPDKSYSQVRVAFTVTDASSGKVVAFTKNNSPAMPRFNLQANMPTVINGGKIVKENAIDINSSIKESAISSQSLPEGDYDFCIKLLDQSGAEIECSGNLCRYSSITIPDPPELISPIDNYAVVYTGQYAAPRFLWTRVANPNRASVVKYLLKIAPVYQGQDDRSAIERNIPVYNQIIVGLDNSYQYLPSDKALTSVSGAVAFVWQVQALDDKNKPGTRNQGKSAIGRFLINNHINSNSSIALVEPPDRKAINMATTKFLWSDSQNGANTEYLLKIAAIDKEDDAESSLNNANKIILSKKTTNRYLEFSADEQNRLNAIASENKDKSFIWRVEAGDRRSNINTFTIEQKMKVRSAISDLVNCGINSPTNTNLSSKTYKKGDKIKIGEFALEFSDDPIKNSDSWQGKAFIEIPFLKNIKLNVSLGEGIKINDNDEAIDAKIYALRSLNLPAIDGMNYDEGNIDKISDLATQAENNLNSISSGLAVSLPISLEKVLSSSPVELCIDDAVFSPNGANIKLISKLKLPALGANSTLYFSGKSCITPTGFTGDKELSLIKEFDLPNSGADKIKFKFMESDGQSKGTYIKYGENGVQVVYINGAVEIPRSVAAPNPDDSKNIEIGMKGELSNNKDLVFEISSDKSFSLSAYKDATMKITSAFIDLSANSNPASIKFPTNYSGVSGNDWTGLYINKATITLDSKFKTNSSNPISAEINSMLIDENGVSGNIGINNIKDINLGGFGSEFNKFSVDILNNSLVKGEIVGLLTLPISSDKLNMLGLIAKDQNQNITYSFTIIPDNQKDYSIDLWKASFKIDPSSSVSIQNINSNFKAKAVLNGKLSINAKLSKVNVNMDLIKVENFIIDENGVRDGKFSFNSPEKSLSGFPINVSEININNKNNKCALHIDANLNLFQDVLSGSVAVDIWAKKSGALWTYDNIEVSEIKINGDMSVAKVKGQVNIFNEDPTYGDGFKGRVDATMMGTLKVSSQIQFGSINSYRYWYFDANVYMNAGIPIFPGISAYGFGGGAYYHMKPANTLSAPPKANADPSSSANTYKPDPNMLGGVKAMVVLGLQPSSAAFNGDVSLEMSFLNNNGKIGLNDISINGSAYFISSLPERSSSLMKGSASLYYNYPNSIFSGSISASANLLGILEGSGTASFYFSPQSWNIKIGDPEKRIEYTLAKIFKVGSYFMIGKDLPPAKMRSDVASHLGSIAFPMRNAGIGKGDGFAFGGNWDLNIMPDGSRAKFLIFYARFGLGIGYDVSLLNYGEGTRCEGETTPIGVNGWYAQGSLYAYLYGSVGLHVDMWFVEGDFEIASITAGAMLAAGLPNPTWGKGSVGAKYSILSGMIKGHFNFGFSFGDECKIIAENPLAKMDLIQSLNPQDKYKDASVFTEPTATFNFPIGRAFSIDEMSQNPGEKPKTRHFKVLIDTLSLSSGFKIDCIQNIKEDSSLLVITPKSVLPGNKNIKLIVGAKGQEYNGSNWADAKKNDGTIIKQIVTSTFSTGEQPKNIPEDNIAYTYPFKGERYFITGDTKSGRIKLKQGQDDLFNPKSKLWKDYTEENYQTDYIARFIPAQNNMPPIEETLNYSNINGMGYIEFPVNRLKQDMPYNLQILRRDAPKYLSAGKNITYLKAHILTGSNNQSGASVNSSLSKKGELSVSKANKGIFKYKKDKLVLVEDKGGPRMNAHDISLQYAGNLSNKDLSLNGAVKNKLTNIMGKSGNVSPNSRISVESKEKSLKNADVSSTYDKDIFASASKVPNIKTKIQINELKNSEIDSDTMLTREFSIQNMTNVGPNDKILYQTFFKTSKYKSYSDKFLDINEVIVSNKGADDDNYLIIAYNTHEPIEFCDMQTITYNVAAFNKPQKFGPIISFNDSIPSFNWFWLYAKPTIYENINKTSMKFVKATYSSSEIIQYMGTAWETPVNRYTKNIVNYGKAEPPYKSLNEALTDWAKGSKPLLSCSIIMQTNKWAKKDFYLLRDRVAANHKYIAEVCAYNKSRSSNSQSGNAEWGAYSTNYSNTLAFYIELDSNLNKYPYQIMPRGVSHFELVFGKNSYADFLEGLIPKNYGRIISFNY